MEIFVLTLIIIAIAPFSSPVTINCDFYTDGDWWVVKVPYYCDVTNILKIRSSDSAVIDGVEGTLPSGITLDIVQGIVAENLTTHFFPRNLEKFFKNLTMIDINHGRLRELHQSDLAPFPQLKCLDLFENDIEVLEDGLFKLNPSLEMIWLSSNKIFHVSPSAFDGLTKLSYVSFVSNPCISKFAKDNKTAASEIVSSAVENCVDLKELEKKFPNLIKTVKSIEKALVDLEEKIDNKSVAKIIYQNEEESRSHVGEILWIFGAFVAIIVAGFLWKNFAHSKRKVSREKLENFGDF